MCEGREGKGARHVGADGTGLAEAAGLISRSDGAGDDLVVCEPAGALAPPASCRPPHCQGPGATPSVPPEDEPGTLAGGCLSGPGVGCTSTRGGGVREL